MRISKLWHIAMQKVTMADSLAVCSADGGFSVFLYADKEVDFYSEFLSALSLSYISHLLSDVHSHLGVRKVTSRGFQRWCKIGFGLLKITPIILI